MAKRDMGKKGREVPSPLDAAENSRYLVRQVSRDLCLRPDRNLRGPTSEAKTNINGVLSAPITKLWISRNRCHLVEKTGLVDGS